MKVCATILFLLFGVALSYSQVTQEWVARYDALGNEYFASSIAVDDSGNVYVTGYSIGMATGSDYFTIKYNSSGVEQWVATYNAPGNEWDIAYSIAVDNSGNVYVTGESYGGTGVGSDYATIKYNTLGVEQWVERYNGPGNDYDGANSIAVDGSGNVYVTGRSYGGIGTSDDYATIKYNTLGIEQWVARYNAPLNKGDAAHSLAVDEFGNVYVTGSSDGGIGKSYDYATIKYNSSGVEQWVARYNGPGNNTDDANSIAFDNEGNVYVTGRSKSGIGNTSYDYATIKYNSSGVEQWVARYNGPGNNGDEPVSLAVDGSGNVYVTGTNWNTQFSQDYATIKYNSLGVEQWIQIYNGPVNSTDVARSLAVDGSGNVYVTGKSYSGTETKYDYATIKYNTLGIEQWVARYDGPFNELGDEGATSIAIDNEGNVYVTGTSPGSNETVLIVCATIKYSQTPLKITKPTSYSKFISSEKDTIKWTDPGWVSVNIKCKTNFGTPSESEIILAQGIPNLTSEFIWNMPDTLLSFRSKIVIENANNTSEKIESDIFRIKPYVLTRLNSDSTYYEYRKNRDQWVFPNDSISMWPNTWWNQFNYSGTDPFTNMQYSQSQGDSVFAKIAPTPNAHPDWVSWVNTFGVDACYFSTLNGWYKPSATIKWWSELDIWNGSCFGIAVSNALSFSYKEQFRTKYPNFPSFINPIIVVSDTGVKRVVNELFTHQFGNPHLALRKLIGLEKTPNETLNDLKEMLAQDNSEIRTLSFLNNGPGGGGHAVLAYGLKKDAVIDGLYYVQIYDNSNPNSNNHIQLNSLAGNGFWAAPDWAGWGGNKWLYLRNPTQQYLLNPTLANGVAQQSSFILGDDVLEVNNTTSVSIQIQDNIGNQTGFKNNLIQLDIPGSIPLVVDNGSKTPPYGYSLPANNYGIVLNEFAEETIKTFFFTGNKSFVYERSGASQTETDRLFFDGGVSATNPDTQTKIVKISNLINEITQEKLFVARSLELTKNDSVKIENPDSNKVKIISYGTAKNYDIELNYVTENEFGRFVDSGVSLAENSSHTFIPVWTELTNSKLQVLVDIGNDGTIDDTLSLVNQVTGIGDNQGLLLSPNSYNLAQNYPNPFNPVTTMQYSVPQKSHINLTIYDILGNEVKILINEQKERGVYTVNFDASGLASGMYICQMRADSFSDSKKMILLK